MTFLVQHIRSGEFARRPQPLDLAPGQLAVNYNSDSTGLYFRTDNGELVKAGPVHVGASAPPQINWTERSVGEMWLDTTSPLSPSMKVYTTAGWVVVNVLDATITTDKIANGAVTASKISLNGTLFPTEDNQFAIGSSMRRLSAIHTKDIYLGDLHLSNEDSGNEVDGTWGKYTIQEGEEDLYLINRRSGRKYKFVLQEV